MINIAIVILFLDLIFLNSVCIGVAMYGIKLFKKMKRFIDVFGGGVIEDGNSKDNY